MDRNEPAAPIDLDALCGHTPGPWFVEADAISASIWNRPAWDRYENGGGVAGLRPLASVHRGWHHEGSTGYPFDENARLMAAAPALLAELTTRRARDEDVAGLGEALVKISDHIRATDPCPDFGWIEAIATEALAPFTGAKP